MIIHVVLKTARTALFNSLTRGTMLFPSLQSIFQGVGAQRPRLLHAATYTVLLTLTAALASFAPETAFVSAISPSQRYSVDGFVRIPLEFPGESACLPAHMVRRSKLDLFVPIIFAGLVVSVSAFVVRSLVLWEGEIG